MSDVFSTDTKFSELGLRDDVLKGIDAMGFEFPTEIQAELIPLIMDGKDVFGQARTGTGKTATFGIPLLHMLDKDTPVQALILVPTRELAIQVAVELEDIGRFTPIKTVAVYGGEPINKQISRLEKNPHIVVGTPGRVMDLQNRRILKYHNIQYTILDEVDRMLDIGFRDDIRRILRGMSGHPQAIFVSATLSKEVEKLAKEFMTDPVKIEAVAGSLTVSQVEMSYTTVQRWDKMRLLYHLLTHEEPDLTLVFCKTKATVDKVAAFLRKKDLEAHAIHGDMPQRKRNQIVKHMHAGTLSVVVASDLAARGLDITGITHVINYDVPEDPEIYIHRIGRTARAGREGVAWSFVTPDDGKLLTQIEMLANREIPFREYPEFKHRNDPPNFGKKSDAAAKEAPEPEKKAPVSRLQGQPEVWKSKEQVDKTKFPDGVVPKGKPKRTLGGKTRTRKREW